jgi:hypothetical protein
MHKQHRVSFTLIEDGTEPWLVTSSSLDDQHNEDILVVVGGLNFRTGDLEMELVKFVKNLIALDFAKLKKKTKAKPICNEAQHVNEMVAEATIRLAAAEKL